MIPTQLLQKAILFSSSTLILIAIGMKPTLAQTEPQYQRSEQDSFSGNDSTGNVNPLDFINQVIVAPSRSMDEFNDDSRSSIRKAADDFKRQREKLLNPDPEPATKQE
ncbi:MAG: hypothetical protein QNJ38_22100 [Prochloraceae cyanobacterium]|nr:hypothetical protein [Prochloraceae cyanobacterium]